MITPAIAKSETRLELVLRSRQMEERWAQFGLLLLVCYATARAVVASIAKPLWFDEINTWIIAHQPNMAAIWSALQRGSDSQPLLFNLIEHVAALIPNAEIGLRLPSVLGFACVMVCVFLFVRERTSSLYGLISAGVVMLTTVYMPYAIEARPYCLVTACVAVAMVAYQRAPAFRWVVLMAFALMIAESLHYYAIFGFVSFAAAEAVFSWKTTRFRPGIWIALVVGAMPLAAFWPLLVHFRALYGQNYWAKPSLWALRDVYGVFLHTSYLWGLAVSLVCGVAVLGLFPLERYELSEEDANCFLHERVLVAFLVATPILVLVITKLAHGAYTDRYMLFSVLGIASAVGIVLPRLGRPTVILCSALLVSGLALQEANFWFSKNTHWHVPSPAPVAERMLHSVGYVDLPVVVTNSHHYLELVYYAPPQLAARLVSVEDAPAALRYIGNDSDDRFLPVLATCFPLRVYNFQTFHTEFPSFLVYSSAEAPDWWLDLLTHDGYGLRLLASEQGHLIFLVTPPEASPN